MNILAHIYLSGNNEEIIFGNFIGDHIKGNKLNGYSDDVVKGIRLHRAIDYFTDTHPAVRHVNTIFREKYGKHAGIVTDIVFDYFLSNNWDLFSIYEFDDFTKSTYKILNNFIRQFPKRVLGFYPFFVLNNWLKQYQSSEGISRVLKGMAKRTSLPDEYQFATYQMEQYHDEIKEIFVGFFHEIIEEVRVNFDIIPDQPNYFR